MWQKTNTKILLQQTRNFFHKHFEINYVLSGIYTVRRKRQTILRQIKITFILFSVVKTDSAILHLQIV